MRAARKIGPIRRALAQILLGVAQFFEWAARLIAPVDAPIDPAYLAVAKRYPGAPEHWLRDIAERMGNFAYAPVQGGTDVRHGGGAPESPRTHTERIAPSDRLMDDWFGAAGPEYAEGPAPDERPSRLPPQVRLRAVPRRVDLREQAFQATTDGAPAARDASSSKTEVLSQTPKPRAPRPRILSSRDATPQDRQTSRREDAPPPAAADTREPSRAATPPRTRTPRTALRVRPHVSLEELPSPPDSGPRAPAVTAPHASDEIRTDKLARTSLEERRGTTEWTASQRPAHTTVQVQRRSPSGRERHEAYDLRRHPLPPDFMSPSAPPAQSVDPQRRRSQDYTSDPDRADESAFASPAKTPWPSQRKFRRQTPVKSRWPDLPQSAPLFSDVEDAQLPSVTARLESLRAEQERGAWSA